jgi:RNA polymerase sigma-70 factor, ECF subfamily
MDENARPLASAPVTFEQVLLPHEDAAYNLARWLMRDEHEAEDCVQEGFLKAYQAFSRFRGADGRPWFLAIVRNVCYTRLRRQRTAGQPEQFDEVIHSLDTTENGSGYSGASENLAELIPLAMERLPAEAREILVLHEVEGLPYKEISTVMEIPIGTVMSRLSRARQKLQAEVARQAKTKGAHGL